MFTCFGGLSETEEHQRRRATPMHGLFTLFRSMSCSDSLLICFLTQEVSSGRDPAGREGSGSVAPQAVPGEGKGATRPRGPRGGAAGRLHGRLAGPESGALRSYQIHVSNPFSSFFYFFLNF